MATRAIASFHAPGRQGDPRQLQRDLRLCLGVDSCPAGTIDRVLLASKENMVNEAALFADPNLSTRDLDCCTRPVDNDDSLSKLKQW